MTKKKEAKKKSIDFRKMMKNHWAVSSVVLAVLLILSLGMNFTGSSISEGKAASIVMNFAADQGVEAVLVDVTKESGLFLVTIEIEGQPVPVYLTADGENLVPSIVPLTDDVATQAPSQTAPAADIPKSDNPKVELYVMTHCPYGTQAEKGFLPAIATLGDAVDAEIKFVHYFLHDPEYTETPTQICIREEQNDKFGEYLTCFLEDGNSARCLDETGVDTTALADCEANRYEDYYAADSALSQAAGVKGSPTLVIDGVVVSTGRSEAAMLLTICSAFNDAPEACNEELSSANPNPGFGWETSGSAASAATAQC